MFVFTTDSLPVHTRSFENETAATETETLLSIKQTHGWYSSIYSSELAGLLRQV